MNDNTKPTAGVICGWCNGTGWRSFPHSARVEYCEPCAGTGKDPTRQPAPASYADPEALAEYWRNPAPHAAAQPTVCGTTLKVQAGHSGCFDQALQDRLLEAAKILRGVEPDEGVDSLMGCGKMTACYVPWLRGLADDIESMLQTPHPMRNAQSDLLRALLDGPGNRTEHEYAQMGRPKGWNYQPNICMWVRDEIANPRPSQGRAP